VSRHVALLRGINVGGKNALPMKDLAEVFSAAGCEAVETYIQSGNVVFEARAAVAAKVAARVTAAILARWKYRVPLVTRSARELRAVADRNPFLAAGARPEMQHVAFLAGVPEADAVAALDVRRSPPDKIAVRGREIYLCLPNGVSGSRFTNAYLDSTLGTTSTLRNWRTVLRLLEMVDG